MTDSATDYAGSDTELKIQLWLCYATIGNTCCKQQPAACSGCITPRNPFSTLLLQDQLSRGSLKHTSPANLLCSKLGVTMCLTLPRASTALLSSGSKPTGLCTQRLPSDSLMTAPRPLTSRPNQTKGRSAPQTFSEYWVSTRPACHLSMRA